MKNLFKKRRKASVEASEVEPKNEAEVQWKSFPDTEDGIEKFVKEWLEMPYTNDRIGQVFIRPYKGRPPLKKENLSSPKPEENRGSK